MSASDLLPALERLRYWHTLDEMAVLTGRRPETVRYVMQKHGCRVLWRRNHHGGFARVWQPKEKYVLLNLIEQVSARRAAELFDRHVDSIYWQAGRLGGWKRGAITPCDVARLAGCTKTYALIVARRIWRRSGPWSGIGKGRRYRLNLEQAEFLMSRIRPGRVYRVAELFTEGEVE